MNVEGMKRFEEMAEIYLHGTKQEQEIILSFLSDEEKKTFLEGCGLYHLFTDEEFYKQARDAIGRQIWEDAHKAV